MRARDNGRERGAVARPGGGRGRVGYPPKPPYYGCTDGTGTLRCGHPPCDEQCGCAAMAGPGRILLRPLVRRDIMRVYKAGVLIHHAGNHNVGNIEAVPSRASALWAALSYLEAET